MTREDMLRYVLERYGTEPEYPWMRDPESAVLRHGGNTRWYGLIMRLPRRLFELPGEGWIDVLNLKLPPALIYILQTEPGYRPAYHMNKTHWLSVLLDGTAPDEEIRGLIDLSYDLTKPKMKKRSVPMNPILEAMKERRSIRKYRSELPKKEDLEKIIEAGLYAASGHGLQSSVIVAITDRALRDRLAEMNRVIGGWQEGYDPFYGAPAVLLVLADRSSPNHVYDGSLSMGNMMLAAHALGLGSCWINRAREEFESGEGKAILAELGLEGDFEGIGHCIVGYPDGEIPAAKPRREGRVFWAK